jgi:hypothetical protein
MPEWPWTDLFLTLGEGELDIFGNFREIPCGTSEIHKKNYDRTNYKAKFGPISI